MEKQKRFIYRSPDDTVCDLGDTLPISPDQRSVHGPYEELELKDSAPRKQATSDADTVHRAGAGLGSLLMHVGGGESPIYRFDLSPSSGRLSESSRVVELRPSVEAITPSSVSFPSTGHFTALWGDLVYSLAPKAGDFVFQQLSRSQAKLLGNPLELEAGTELTVTSSGKHLFRVCPIPEAAEGAPYAVRLSLPNPERVKNMRFRFNVPHSSCMRSDLVDDLTYQQISAFGERALNQRFRQGYVTPYFGEFSLDDGGKILNTYGVETGKYWDRLRYIVSVHVGKDARMTVADARHTVSGFKVSDPLLERDDVNKVRALPREFIDAINYYNNRL